MCPSWGGFSIGFKARVSPCIALKITYLTASGATCGRRLTVHSWCDSILKMQKFVDSFLLIQNFPFGSHLNHTGLSVGLLRGSPIFTSGSNSL